MTLECKGDDVTCHDEYANKPKPFSSESNYSDFITKETVILVQQE